ncbi:CBS domain-containing protein [Haloechinothrix sp. LS1_15]|uniref:CBS domain-containing protein n=1 Tax=Haloechinothrix sp. LS1_15 TaxID=2652248 RepID=UPI002948076D|nr:CBS domain-containing protein [Haloechinothrix sp. LS1_15]MDV6010962.1 CBS domain-containing protein [Haloechinothrix sp. LS1_15]
MSDLAVADVMTTEVISVDRATPFKAAVRLLAEHRISAVPVVDPGGRLIGVVSEADLLVKELERGREHTSGSPTGGKAARRLRQASARTVGDVMTRPVRTISPSSSLLDAALHLHRGKLRRLFVTDGDNFLIGILARRDVLRVFTQSDAQLASTINREVLVRALWVMPYELSVDVADGEVTLSGVLYRRSEVTMAEELTAEIPGVVAVHNQLAFSSTEDKPYLR